MGARPEGRMTREQSATWLEGGGGRRVDVDGRLRVRVWDNSNDE